MRNLFVRRGSEPEFAHPSPSPQGYGQDLDGVYPRKQAQHPLGGGKDKDTVMLETPMEDPTDGLDVKDMIISVYDQKARTSVWQICLAVAVGVGIGVMLAEFKVNATWAAWIALPGDLFINALKCLIIPMVFCSVVVCIGELAEVGKAVSIGSRTVAYFSLASIVSSSLASFTGYIFSSFYTVQIQPSDPPKVPNLIMQCQDGGYLTALTSGLLRCVAANVSSADSTSGSAEPVPVIGGNSMFLLNDTSSYFAVQQSPFAVLTVSEQVFSILRDLVPDNIVSAFATSSTLSVIIFAVCFGIALARSVDRAREGDNYPLLLITHMNVICRMLINHVVSVIPFAIVSMIAGSMAEYSSSLGVIEDVAWLAVTLFVGLFTLTIGFMGTWLFLTTGRNVFSYLREIVPAQVFALGCSSSIATLPITMRCVDATREVSPALSRFVLPLTATSNLNGSAMYMVIACIFMAKVGGFEEDLTPVRYVLLAFVGAISSFGVAPVPHSGLVMAITVWRTVFNRDLPQVFSLLVGMDWLLNRMRCVVNVTNSTIVCRIIAEQCDETTVMELYQRDEAVAAPASPEQM